MNISIIGAGYVGLVTGACLAERGHRVICVDMDAAKVACINGRHSPFYEKHLNEMLEANVGSSMAATTDLRTAILETNATFIAVGTPFNGIEIDLTSIQSASTAIGSALREKTGYHAVVVKSTVVPGTTEKVVQPLIEAASGKAPGKDFGVAMNPEFLTEGNAVENFMNADRLVLGSNDFQCLDVLEKIYSVFPGVPVIRTSPRTAEMIKYASNSLLATLISFSNELANLCTAIGGIDIVDVMSGLHSSSNLTTILPDGMKVVAPITRFLHAGCGFGGSCLPKDVKALIAKGIACNEPMPLLKAVIQTNEHQHLQVIELLKKHFSSLRNARVCVLGLSFKPGTDDMRESPSIPVIMQLLNEDAIVSAYDPVALPVAMNLFKGRPISFSNNIADAIRDVDAIVLMTRWDQFSNLHTLMNAGQTEPVVIDARRMLNPNDFTYYEGIGR